MKLKEKSWLAGVIDCDGCIFTTRYKHKFDQGQSLYPAIKFANNSKKICEEVVRLTGGNIYFRPADKIDSDGIKRKDRYEVSIYKSEKVRSILLEIKDYLIIKKEKAEKCIEIINNRKK